jgi:serine/threonine protein kinase
VVGLIVLLWRQHKSKQHNPDDDDSDCEEQQARAELERGVAATGPRRYAYGELAAATSNFAEDEKLGRGGFGSVYLGKLAAADVCGGQEQPSPVAIKKFTSESSAQGRKEFEAEVRIISRLKHRNLVQLLGWCDSCNGLLLVYELVAKGSLDKHLYSSHTLLTWPQRYGKGKQTIQVLHSFLFESNTPSYCY